MAAAATPTAPPARTAADQAVSSSAGALQRNRGEDSRNRGGHETRAPLASRHPNDDRPPARTHHRRPAEPVGGCLAMALRDRSANRTGGSPCTRNHLSGVLPTTAVGAVITLAILGLPLTRQFVLNRAWCIITAHRVRVGCAEAMIYSSRGKIPIILWTAHQPFGERILLWCRAGTSIGDFVTSRAMLTSACWAQDIAVLPDLRHPHLVTLDVIRRPPYNVTSEPEGSRTTDPPDWSAWPGDEEA